VENQGGGRRQEEKLLTACPDHVNSVIEGLAGGQGGGNTIFPSNFQLAVLIKE
jgi:hypothetical protein